MELPKCFKLCTTGVRIWDKQTAANTVIPDSLLVSYGVTFEVPFQAGRKTPTISKQGRESAAGTGRKCLILVVE